MSIARWILALVLSLPSFHLAAAQTAVEIKKYAKDGKSLTQSELKVYLLHLASPILTEYDKNLNGKIDPAEASMIVSDAEKKLKAGAVAARRDEILVVAGNRARVPIDELAGLNPAPAKKNEEKTIPLYVRRDRIDVGIAGFAANPVPTSDAQGARVSYSRDGLTRDEVWTVDGRASYVIANGDFPDQKYTKGVPQVTAYALVPWVDIRRQTSTNPKAKMTDLTSTGLDAAFEIYGGPFGGVSYLTISPSMQTDRTSDAQIFDLAAHWQPYGILGIGTWRNVSPWLQFTWHAGLDGVYRDVKKPGSFILPGTEFAWGGGWIQGKWRFGVSPDYMLTLTTTYSQYHDWTNKRDAELFTADLAYQIDPKGLTSVSLTYKRGRDWTTYSQFDLLTAGLNFKL